jgi:hypothetical protein
MWPNFFDFLQKSLSRTTLVKLLPLMKIREDSYSIKKYAIMRKALLIVFSLSIIIIGFNSCDKGGGPVEPIDNCVGVAQSWAANVNPIIQTYCNQATCHDVASSNGPGPLTNYAQVFSARALIKDQVANGLMPQNTTLTNAQKLTIICWVNSGAPNN